MKNLFTCYFGAANGFSGFRSYFSEIFSAKDFTRIYVLKGGPGTGKSSLMKKVSSYFENKDYLTEKIYCSSDPNSLDGVIIYRNGKKIAILDGTAPHETDAKIPGAADEIINLGNMWDRGQLIEKRNLIESLNENKRFSYRNAYRYLRHAGNFFKDIYSLTTDMFNILNASNEIDKLFKLANINQSRSITKKILSSFSKHGYKTLNLDNMLFSEYIYIAGIFGSEYAFINILKNKLLEKNYDLFIFPSPYSDDLTEAIYIPYTNTFIGINTDGKTEKKIDTVQFLNKNELDRNSEMLSDFDKRYSELLLYAKKEFQNASDYHFALEAIYTPAMNFEILNETTEKLIDDILYIFESSK